MDVLWRTPEHEPLSERPWDAALAGEAIRTIVIDAERAADDGLWPGHPLDDLSEERRLCSLYIGAAGMVWALSRLGSSLDCRAAVEAALDRYRTAPDPEEAGHPPSLLAGETGPRVVAEKVGSPAAERGRLSELVRANREHDTWELLWGSPGTILAARACGLDDEWRESAQLLYAHWDESTGMWPHRLAGQAQPYLGPPHGFAGCVHALRGFVDEDTLRARATRVLDRIAIRRDGLVNWPPLDLPGADWDSTIRVQWCHGAPGIVATLGDLIPLELAASAGELIWRAGPLRKGPGLCHGTAGNGFAFLRLHQLTGDPRWLERARRFAMHAIEQVDRERARFGRGRYTLWTGDIGVALYLRACMDAVPDFPVVDGF